MRHFNIAAHDHVRAQRVKEAIHGSYRVWGHDVLKAIASNLDYSRYGIHDKDNKFLNAHFYDAASLASEAVRKGKLLVREAHSSSSPPPIFFISLDEMIEKQAPHWGAIAFSRLFSTDGRQQTEYRARPGSRPLDEQYETIRKNLEELHKKKWSKIADCAAGG